MALWVMMRLSFRKVAVTVLGLYALVTCYTGYMLIKKKFDKAELIVRKPKNVKGKLSNMYFIFTVES